MILERKSKRRKLAITKQPNIEIFEDASTKDSPTYDRQGPPIPATEFKVSEEKCQPEWFEDFKTLSTNAAKYNLLAKNVQHLRNVPFPDRIYVAERKPTVKLPLHVNVKRPEEIWDLFWPKWLLTDIAKHTNIYAHRKREEQVIERRQKGMRYQLHRRPWRDVNSYEIGAFFGVLLMQGIHELQGKLDLYWSTLIDEPLQPVTEFISRDRFQQIARYIKISDPTQEDDLDSSEWFTKIEPVASHFRKTAQEIYIPGSHVSVDEQLLKFTGRSKHLTEISSKAAGTGYKIYTEAEAGYLIDLR